MKSKLNRD